MRSAPVPQSGGLFVPPKQAQYYVINGWTVVNDLSSHRVLVIPPTRPTQRSQPSETRDGS
jgi:hypothetical protein